MQKCVHVKFTEVKILYIVKGERKEKEESQGRVLGEDLIKERRGDWEKDLEAAVKWREKIPRIEWINSVTCYRTEVR